MSIFTAIKNAIFGAPAQASESDAAARAEASITTAAAGAAPSTSAADTANAIKAAAASAASATAAGAAAATGAAASSVDVAKILDGLTKKRGESGIDWRKSIVDLMKLLNLDSSLKARKELATELGYTGDMGDSAKMNVWLHKQVMTKLAENGGVVPSELRS